MKSIKTAKGKILDMGALVAKNEKTRAISNMPINARGDIIDNRGEVKVKREDISKEFYKNNVPNADTKETSIKEDATVPEPVKEVKPEPKPEPKPQPKPEPKPEPKPQPEPTVNEDPIEVSRRERERPDGSKYFEVEYLDGSIEEIEIEK